MAASKTLFEQFLAPIFGQLIDQDAIRKLRDSIDWETEIAIRTNPQVTYPDYYRSNNFHGIKGGYLTTSAAVTYDPITQYVLLPNETWVRESLVNAIQGQPDRILDLGCGTGTTTRLLKQRFPQASVTGLDLSPHMLLVAEHQARESGVVVDFVHGDASATGFPDQSFDVVCATLLLHETPTDVSKAILRESFRLLKPGGQVLILDGNQKTLRSVGWLSNIFEEPFIEVYGQGSVDAWLGSAGFEAVRTEDAFWLNQLSIGQRPLSVTAPQTDEADEIAELTQPVAELQPV